VGNEIPAQLTLFFRSILLGLLLALGYDMTRPVRALGGKIWGTILDIAVSLFSVVAVFLFVMAGDGELRLFILLGALGGMVVFFGLLGPPLRPLWALLTKIFLFPIRLVWIFLEKFAQIFKKAFSFFKSWFTIICTSLPHLFSGMWKTRRGVDTPEKGDEPMAKARKKRKLKKRPSSKLTLLLLLVVMLGVGVQILRLHSQIQAAQAEQLVYAQRLHELQTTNAKLQEDLDNQDSQELIEDIARDELGMVSPGEKIFRYGS
jgi:cell division protein FtsB